MGVKTEKILILRFSDESVYYERLDDNPEFLSRIFKRFESLRMKLLMSIPSGQSYPLSHSETLELFESEKLLFGNVSALVFIIDSIDIRSFLRGIQIAKNYLDLSLQKLQQYSPNASVFLFHPKVDIKEEVQKTLIEDLLSGVNKQVKYYTDVKEIVQKIREMNHR